MDLIVNRYNHAILTIVERSTNMLFITRLPHGKKSELLAKEVRRLLLPYRKHIKTITTDNGPEFAAHKLITEYWERSFTLPTRTPHGRKEPLKIQTSSSGSTYESRQTSMISQTKRLRAYRRK